MKKIIFISISLLFLLSGCNKKDENLPPEHDSIVNIKEKKSECKKTLIKRKNIKEDSPILDAEIIKVIDGNTFVANLNREKEIIRLLLVDIPVEKNANNSSQRISEKTKAFTKEFLKVGDTVAVEFDSVEEDKEGRILAYVYSNGKMLNEELLKNGLAHLSVSQPNTKYIREFTEIQEKAQEQKIGMWSDEYHLYDAFSIKHSKGKVSEKCKRD